MTPHECYCEQVIITKTLLEVLLFARIPVYVLSSCVFCGVFGCACCFVFCPLWSVVTLVTSLVIDTPAVDCYQWCI